MTFSRLLVANRGEVAIRISRAAMEANIGVIAVFAEDDASSGHVRKAHEAAPLKGTGVQAYLDIEQLIELAARFDCDAVHPGYGFLSENPRFARRCAESGLTFVGPRAELLELFGDKATARAAARDAGVPILEGSSGAVSAGDAMAFFNSLGAGEAMMIKAVAGGGGRGMRMVTAAEDVEAAFERCSSEADAAFGSSAVYVERCMPRARHIEVQILGDGSGQVTHLWERDCSVQRRHQKLVEIAPSPGINPATRDEIIAAAVSLAAATRYDNIGTFEFLLNAGTQSSDEFAFIEANPRLQVEHTVTEDVTGVDIVSTQLRLAAGETLTDLNLLQENVPPPQGYAVQTRVNTERMSPDGTTLPTGGTLNAFDPPSGPGVRTDTFGYAGYTTSPHYDSLLAKVIGHATPGFASAAARTYRALCEFRIEGCDTNIGFLQNVLTHPQFIAGDIYTRFVDDHSASLATPGSHEAWYFHTSEPTADPSSGELAGARIDASDPLAVLDYGQSRSAGQGPDHSSATMTAAGGPAGTLAVAAPLQGTIVSIAVAAGDPVSVGQTLAIMESMKMEHEIRADVSGRVSKLNVNVGDTIHDGHPLAYLEEMDVEADTIAATHAVDLDHVRPDLEEIIQRHERTLDAARPSAVERRRRTKQRTARENIEDLCDAGTFVEYGPLVLAAQRRRRSLEDLIEKTPADGMITGVGAINSAEFDDPACRCAVMAYDYTVLAGTQGGQNHRKTDRLIDVAEQGEMPLVLFAEGGGGRPGDTDGVGVSTQTTFSRFAQLSGLVPMVGITSGRCFAGNASLLGCCDVIIATANANIGMGGPAMIEGGGLGIYAPEEIGPMSVQTANGVVDVAVADEAEAVAVAKQYLSYFQGRISTWESPDQRHMRRIVPENRLRVYEVREVIDTIADTGSVLEIRRDFGIGMITAFIRIEGRAVGVIANNPRHLGGAIDSDAADKAARFMQLCDAFDVPILYFCDTPGIMVGPQVEETALVRHSSRMFVIGANLSVPFFTIILRKSYGLGAIAMSGGSHHTPMFSVAWPTGEFGGMGLEGSVKLGYRDELAAIEDPDARLARFEEMVANAYEHGKALNQASLFGIDDTIDPTDSRWWVASALRSVRPRPRQGKKRAAVDAW